MPTSSDGILTATYDPTIASVRLVVDGGMWPAPVTFITVTRTPVGQPAVPVRGLEERRVQGGWYIGTDGEMPLDVDVTYAVVGYDSFGDVVPVGQTNLAPDPRLATSTMSTNGATVSDTRPSSGADDGGSFFRRTMTTANTTSPMSMQASPTGTGAIPVTPGSPIVASWDSRKNPGLGPAGRADFAWYDAAGVLIGSVVSGTGQAQTGSWQRFSQVHTPPALAAFGQPRLAWTGTALVAQQLDLGRLQVEHGTVATPFKIGFLAIPTEVTVSTTGAEWGMWLKAPGRVDLNVRLPLASRDGMPSTTQGGSYPVISGAEVHAWSGIAADRTTIQLRTRTTAQEAALYSLLSQYRVVMIQSGQPAELGHGSEWWFVTDWTPSNPAQVRSDTYEPRLHSLQIVRSGVPDGAGLVSTGATYSAVSAQYATYADLLADVATYGDLMTPGV